MWKAREKNDLKAIKSHGKIVWRTSLKKSIKICPKCARIVTSNYLISDAHCASCDVPYVDLGISGLDYYDPELKGERVICNKMAGEIQEAKKRLSDFISYYLPAVKLYCDNLDEHRTDDALLREFAYTINHIHSVLRGQSFLGQGKAVNFWTLVFMEIEQRYFAV